MPAELRPKKGWHQLMCLTEVCTKMCPSSPLCRFLSELLKDEGTLNICDREISTFAIGLSQHKPSNHEAPLACTRHAVERHALGTAEDCCMRVRLGDVRVATAFGNAPFLNEVVKLTWTRSVREDSAGLLLCRMNSSPFGSPKAPILAASHCNHVVRGGWGCCFH